MFAAVAFVSAVFADGPQIELSDAETVIEETGIVPEKEAVPDFSLLLPLEPSALPVLADADISADTLIQSEAPGSGDASDQDVFLEGAIGAGWPGFFSGDFSVYRNIGAEPFSLEFFHESVMGMGKHTAPDGYESQETRLLGEKQFALGKTVLLDAAAGYETRTDGLQGKNPGFYDISRQNVTGSAVFNWKPADLLSFTGSVSGVFNTQFLSSSLPLSDTRTFAGMKTAASLAFDREVWGMSLSLAYDFGTEQSRFEADASFSADIGSYAGLALSAGAVSAKQSDVDVIVPFAVSLTTGAAVPFSGSVSGGLRSAAFNPVSLQKESPFIFTGTVPVETTEWFGEAAADVPFYELGMLNLSAEYAKTAYDGNRILPDYASLDGTTGLVKLDNTPVTVLDSSVGMTVPFKGMNASVGWNASWINSTRYDRTRGMSSALTAGLSYAEDNGIWSAGADMLWAPGCVPELGLNGCFQVTRNVRLELDVQDIIPLLTGNDRLVCNTYAQRGGFAALFVKVNF